MVFALHLQVEKTHRSMNYIFTAIFIIIILFGSPKEVRMVCK